MHYYRPANQPVVDKIRIIPEILSVVSKRIEYQESIISNGDSERYFDFYDTRMRHYYLAAVETILRQVGSEGKVLDIGCGAAVFGVLLADKTEYFNVVGLERSGLLVRTGEAITSRVGYRNRISLKIWNEDALPFPDAEFDAVVSLMSLHRWGGSRNIFREIERVRKPKSVVYISDFRRELMFPPFFLYAFGNRLAVGRDIAADLVNSHKASYTTDELRSMLDESGLADWRIEKNKRLLTVSSIYGIGEPKIAADIQEN